jgi:hypothetical protein
MTENNRRRDRGLPLCAAIVLSLLAPWPSLAVGYLIVNEGEVQAKRVVYEIPNADGRDGAIRYIKDIRDRFFPGMEIVDATKSEDSVLKEKLKSGFILYTTFGSRAFKAASEPLRVEMADGKLRWADLNVAVTEDLRVIFVGKNPYGDGYCVVYAAGSNRSLVDINNCFHGPCSYHVFKGSKLLKEGFYNRKFGTDPDRISKADALADIQQFFSTMQRVHPDLLAKVELGDYLKLKQQTAADVSKKLDKDGKIGASDLAYSLYYAAAFFRDGHTSVDWQQLDSSQWNKRLPPWFLSYDNGRFVVAASTDKSIEGLEVVAVEGKPVREFLAPILDRCSGETLTFKAVRFAGNQQFWYCFSNLCGSAQSLTFKLRDKQGNERDGKADTVSSADFQKLRSNARTTKLEELRRRGSQVRFLDSDRIAYFIYPQFNLNELEKEKINDIFKQIKTKKSRDLIVDIRGNGGGNSTMGDFIFSYLYGNKFTSFSTMRVRFSHDLLALYAKDGQLSPDANIDGIIATCHATEESVPKPDAFFTGRAFLLVDNGTFSSASNFAAMFRDYGVGKILGYETGGLPVCFGDIYPFTLQNSGIPCGVSWKQFFGPKPRPGDDEHGVVPDVPMNDAILQPHRNEEDPVLEFTIDHIKKTRPLAKS